MSPSPAFRRSRAAELALSALQHSQQVARPQDTRSASHRCPRRSLPTLRPLALLTLPPPQQRRIAQASQPPWRILLRYSTSSTTHLHTTFELAPELELALVIVAPALHSLALWTAVPKPQEDADPREGKQHASTSLEKVYPLLSKLTHLALAGELVSSPPSILLPSLRQLEFLCGPFNTYEVALKDWLTAMYSDPVRRVPFVRLLGRGLTEFTKWIRGDLEELASEARVALWYEEDT